MLHFFSVMAAECTDIATVEELRHFSLWVENGSPVEQFMGILPLKKAMLNLSVLQRWLKKKHLQCHKLVGMGVDGAAMLEQNKMEFKHD